MSDKDRDDFVNILKEFAPRCFIAVMYIDESMYFLRKLTNRILDKEFPKEFSLRQKELQSAMTVFQAVQPMFFAGVMKVDDYVQIVKMPPFASVEKTATQVRGREVYTVEVLEGHMNGGEERKFFMVEMKLRAEAEEDGVLHRGKFAFLWKEGHFLCYK